MFRQLDVVHSAGSLYHHIIKMLLVDVESRELIIMGGAICKVETA